MHTIQILNRWSGNVIHEVVAETVCEALVKLVDEARKEFKRANLGDANLGGANLRGANLRGADLGGANLGDLLSGVPVVPELDRKIAAAVGEGGEHLFMGNWHHPCGTSHCRAGWAVQLAGEEGKALESRVGPALAGALIYMVSTDRRTIPNFHASDADALADIKRCASLPVVAPAEST